MPLAERWSPGVTGRCFCQAENVRHHYECPLRWADQDPLGHVNNVAYVDYLQEARVDMMRRHSPALRSEDGSAGLVVVDHRLDYLAPLHYRSAPVIIECWVTEVRAASFTMAYEMFDQTPAGRVVYLRASTRLTPFDFASERPRRISRTEKEALVALLEPTVPAPLGPWHEGVGQGTHDSAYPVAVRFSDLDPYGHVNNVQYVTYLQEARISMFTDLAARVDERKMQMVVAGIEVEYRRSLTLREAPYDAWSRIVRMGNKSLTVQTDIRDGDELMARGRSAVVFFDAETGRAVEPSARLRTALSQLLG